MGIFTVWETGLQNIFTHTHIHTHISMQWVQIISRWLIFAQRPKRKKLKFFEEASILKKCTPFIQWEREDLDRTAA